MCAESAQKSTPDQIVRPDPATVRAKKREIACRYKAEHRYKKREKPPFSMATKRVAELRRLFVSRYGNELPDDDSGRDDAKLMLDHIAACPNASPEHLEKFLRQWCPWLEPDAIGRMTADAMGKPLRYRADTLAHRLGLTDAERSGLKITTIGAIDLTNAEREARRREQSRERSRRYRARNRTMTRAAYLAASISRTKPWEALGMKRRTWYRRGKPLPQTDSGTGTERSILPFNKRDATCATPPVSHHAAPPPQPARNNLVVLHPKNRIGILEAVAA
jgi:hypothetical protein